MIDDDSTHVCMSFYVRKRGHFSVSLSRLFLSKNAKSVVSSAGDDVVVNGASERAREQSASSNHRYVPTKRVITSEFNVRSHDGTMMTVPPRLSRKQKN